ncbi:MAG: electron transfer flavoprotein subunit beta/FixA family protein [Synergistaceae bacterium]|jgi:electron transfer flavoprotein beta subunit|nr:electron transfer flavoprotein subunit beta/FixA family protein [Synergistaceae bacterium]
MDIAVCIKQVPVSNDVSVDPVTHSLVRESAESMLNPADANALEEAIALKERHSGRVVAFTMGPPSAEKALRTALAMGADDAVLITDRAFAGADTVATAKVLAESVRRYGAFDLVMAGSESSDGATGQVGPMLAEYLALPHLTDIRRIEAVEAGRLHALKKFKNGFLRAAVTLPAVLTVSYGCNEPRLPTFLSQISANKRNIPACTNKELALPPEETGLAGSPTEVIDTFAPERRKRAEFLSGTPEEVAGKILTLIEKKRGTDNG